jgi:glycosyltransferase involved in cell wall biosynthesis
MTKLTAPPLVERPAGRRPRIALINQPLDGSLPPRQTSLAIWSYQVAHCLADACDMVVYGRRHAAGPAVEARDGVTFVHIPNRFDRRIMRWLERFGSRRPVTQPVVASRWYCREYAERVAADVRRRDCDLALVFNYSQFAPVLKRHKPDLHVVLDMQCEWASQFDGAMIGRRLKSVDTVVGCSAYVAERVRERFPEFPGACRALYNGVSPAQFATDARAPIARGEHPRVLFVGRVSPEKGLHVLIEAFAHVVRRFPDAQLDIVGAQAPCPREILVDLSDDPLVLALARFYGARSYHEQLLELVSALGIEENVKFSGFLPHAESVQHYHQSWVLANPSLSEAFGMSLVEGMAAGLPVVATRVGGMVEIVEDGVTGRLVSPDDPRALADVLSELLSDETRRTRMGIAGRARAAERFSWERIAGDLAALAHGAARRRE